MGKLTNYFDCHFLYLKFPRYRCYPFLERTSFSVAFHRWPPDVMWMAFQRQPWQRRENAVKGNRSLSVWMLGKCRNAWPFCLWDCEKDAVLYTKTSRGSETHFPVFFFANHLILSDHPMILHQWSQSHEGSYPLVTMVSHGFPMVFPWFSHGFPTVFLWFFRWSPLGRAGDRSRSWTPLGNGWTLKPSAPWQPKAIMKRTGTMIYIDIYIYIYLFNTVHLCFYYYFLFNLSIYYLSINFFYLSIYICIYHLALLYAAFKKDGKSCDAKYGNKCNSYLWINRII